ncbi:FtsX-like permease family protein [Kitasatospora sp. NPDC002227]|uniref:ABC transporter permease n=1 Tax=Kitasatospora sp. NPDC002227 TaxID=3154773 RepID=UPI00332CCD00
MSAVLRAARAAVARRRLQTFVLGVVVLVSSAMVVATLGLLAAVSGPFDQVYAAAKGAHVVAEFDAARVTPEQLTRAAHTPGVSAVAGPYPEAVLHQAAMTGERPIGLAGALTVVGRDRTDTPVDVLKLSAGRWATAVGEIVLDLPPGLGPLLITTDRHLTTPDGTDLKVVGYTDSASRSAGGWVTPEQARALHAGSWQMMYRFHRAGSEAELRESTAAATTGLPEHAMTGVSSYLAIKAALAKGPGTYVPFLTVFGVLGLLVSVLIVGNVVSGAVVSGFRHIGILKALGFTPNQVTAVYLLMVTAPAAAGCALGAVVGGVVGKRLVRQAFWGISGGQLVRDGAGIPGWAYPVVLLGMPALAVLSALLPALRARRLPAAVAVSAGGAPRTGRGLAVQRWLSGSRLPRAVSLGLGWPFARPGRTALTLSTVVLGVTTVTLALGLSASVVGYGRSQQQTDVIQVQAQVGNAQWDPTPATHTDEQLMALLRAMPGTAHVRADAPLETRSPGSSEVVQVGVQLGDSEALHPDLVRGRWTAGPGEAVVSGEYWRQHRVSLGQTIVLTDADGRAVPEKVVGETSGGWDVTSVEWDRFVKLSAGRRAMTFSVQLTPGTDPAAYAAAAGRLDPGLRASVNGGADTMEKVIISVVSTLTLLLIIVSALGVFNTVVLGTRERRKDLGMLKSIGMTPRQVVAMVVTAMTALGALGGLAGVPLGMLAHRIVIPATGRSTGIDLPASLLHVWRWQVVLPTLLAGAVIAALGAYLPARGAAKTPVAEVLRTE